MSPSQERREDRSFSTREGAIKLVLESACVLAPIGSIETKSGALEFGNVGPTECVFLRFVGGTGGAPCPIYTAGELKTLLTLLRLAEELSKTSRPGSMTALGTLRAKPILLRIALVHPNAGTPFALFRMIHGSWKLDLPLPIRAAIELFQQGERSEPSPPVCGKLRRDPTGAWLVAGQELHPVSGMSPGVGQYGEYLHPDEVRDGEDVVVWSFSAKERTHIGAFRTLEQWQPPGEVTEPMPQEGDVALFNGETYRCRQIHRTFAQTMLDSDNVDPVWAAKIALSSLLCDVADGDDEAGHATWVGHVDDPVLQMGIAALEEGQASSRDSAIYQMVSCYFHSLGADQAAATQAVNEIMERLFTEISESDPLQRRLLLHNWAAHLKEIYQGKAPGSVADPWKGCKARYPGRIIPKVVSFPPPHPWVVDGASAGSPSGDADARPQESDSGSDEPAWNNPGEAAEPHNDSPSLDGGAEWTPKGKQAGSGKRKGGSKIAVLALLSLIVLGVVGFAGYQAFAGAKDRPASVAQATATPTAATAAPPQAIGVATPAPPAAASTAETSPSAVPPPAPAGRITLGKVISIGGVDPDGRYYVDRNVEGMTMLEQGPGWARYEKDGFQVFMGIVQSGTIKSTRAKAFASQALFSDGKKVLQAGTPVDQIDAGVVERLESEGIDMIVDEKTNTLLGFSSGDFPETTIALGQPSGAELLTAFESRDLQSFRDRLTAETANLKFMDGESIFAKIAAQPGTTEYCQALVEAGASLEGEGDDKAWKTTSDPAIIAMMTKGGVAPNHPGPHGRSKLFGAGPVVTKALLQAGANPNLQDEEGATPLFHTDDPETIKILVKGGAKPNLANNEGKTPLMGRNLEVTRTLLALGADPKLKDKNGQTATDLADSSVAAVLKKRAKAP